MNWGVGEMWCIHTMKYLTKNKEKKKWSTNACDIVDENIMLSGISQS